MDTETFTDEATRLSRPCQLLRDAGSGDPCAFWHGSAIGLWASIFHNGQWLNVYLHDDYSSGHVDVSNAPTVSDIPLFGTPGTSLPPVDAVFLLGSDAITRYLTNYDWPRNEPFNNNFPHPTPAEYESHWQTDCRLYQSGVSIMLGGWHMPWPDGDWYDFADAELVAWTFRDSEPWVEVFLRNGSYVVKQRIS